DLDRWADAARAWTRGEAPDGLDYVEKPATKSAKRDAFLFFINGAKVRAPAAAEALIERVGR
ncbi:MAG TPA: DUF72 domain-containing protein, partial [Allosphingosinicella sp.]